MRKNLHDLASILNISSVTLERWIIQGKIPVSRKNGCCEFDPEILKEWAFKRKIAFTLSSSDCSDNISDGDESLLYRAVTAGGVYYNIIADSPESAIRRIAELVPLNGRSQFSEDTIVKALNEREKIRSTGVGKGVAVPHPMKPMPEIFPESVVMICFLSEAVDFSSPDSLPVTVVFPVFASSQSEHLKLLSEISICLRNSSFLSLLKSVPERHLLMSELSSMKFR